MLKEDREAVLMAIMELGNEQINAASHLGAEIILAKIEDVFYSRGYVIVEKNSDD